MKTPVVLMISLVLVSAACSSDGGKGGGNDMGVGLATFTSDCAEPTGAGVQHAGNLTADETWTAADSPHIVTSDVVVRGGVTLTIEPCAVVRVRDKSSIIVGAHSASDGTGKLLAQGTYDAATEIARPVVFAPELDSGHWGSLQVLATGTAELLVTAIIQAGANDDGALVLWGDDNRKTPLSSARAIVLIVQDSAGLGINVRTSGGFSADSAGVLVSGAGSQGHVTGDVDTRYGVYVEAPAIHTLPSGTYTGNAVDAILAKAPFVLQVDEAFPDRGVPYQIVNSFDMVPPAIGQTITLHVDPGVTVKVGGAPFTNPRLGLGSGNGGSGISAVRLDAPGTADKPIKLTSGSATPAAGDWSGILWQGGPTSGNVMSHVIVEYGGGPSQTNGFGCGPKTNDALVLINYWRPDTAFIQSCTFAHSAGGGIVSGWDSDAAGPNLRADNTFTDIADPCQVSQPASANHVCPGNDFTPDCY